MSRKMEFEELISVLVAEHLEMKKDLADAKQAVSNRDFSTASKILGKLDDLFRQHITDEEAQVLRILIDAYGVKGADEAIIIFRQHRPIYQLMEMVRKLSLLSPEELASDESKLKKMLDEHIAAEESRVFPRAVSTYKERTGTGQ